MRDPMRQQLRDLIRVFVTFFTMSMRLALSYPMGFVLSQLGMIVPVFGYYFVGQLVGGRPSVGGDYYSFAVTGLVGTYLILGGLRAFGNDLVSRVQQGQFEMLLTEPVGWRILPIGIAAWPLSWEVATSVVVLFASIPLGAHYRMHGIPLALLVGFLGTTAGLAIGLFSGAVRVLSKGSDPIVAIYVLFIGVLSGVSFPLVLLPPVLRAIAWLLPSTYLVYGLRAALLPGGAIPGAPDATQALVFLALFDLIVFPAAIAAFGRSLEVGRRLGVLAGY
jgi:ABC-2 type transport system permease protein